MPAKSGASVARVRERCRQEGVSVGLTQGGTHNKLIDRDALRHSNASFRSLRLRRLDDWRPFETTPRTRRLSTQHEILCLRAPRFTRCFTA